MSLASRDHKDSVEFRQFRRDLFHSSLQHILSSLRPHMMTPRVTRCGDGHYRRIIYCLGPYIADYPEQVLLACIVQGWCPRYVQYNVDNMTQTDFDCPWRCTAPGNDLDSPACRRSHEHTEALFDVCTVRELWDNYGVINYLVDLPIMDQCDG